MKTKIIQIRKGILDKNDMLAHKLRQDFNTHKVFVVNLVSSPGSGKTALLIELIQLIKHRGLSACAVVGDLATENDAQRLRSTDVDVFQINTDGNCHLDATMIRHSLTKIRWKKTDFLFIENIGNLVCPASYDLGEHLRIVLMSVTEGEDKPLKYPTMFYSSDVCIISKQDLAQACDFNHQLAIENIKRVNPDITIYNTSAKQNSGIAELLDHLIYVKTKNM